MSSGRRTVTRSIWARESLAAFIMGAIVAPSWRRTKRNIVKVEEGVLSRCFIENKTLLVTGVSLGAPHPHLHGNLAGPTENAAFSDAR